MIDCAYKADMIVENKVVVELKAQLDHLDSFEAQTLTNMKFSKKNIGLCINFHHKKLTEGLKRYIF